jgi:hypothetical protein
MFPMIRNFLRAAMLGVVILWSINQSVNHLISTKQLGSLEQDPVTIWESKFNKLKKALPTEVKTVGYLADWDIEGMEYSNGDQHGEYVLMQYVLSPIIAVRDSEQEWIIGNLTSAAYEKWLRTTRGKYEVTFFKHNLYLIHKIER